jgi:hypothetical protein
MGASLDDGYVVWVLLSARRFACLPRLLIHTAGLLKILAGGGKTLATYPVAAHSHFFNL